MVKQVFVWEKPVIGYSEAPPSWLSSWAPLSLFQIQEKTENYFWRTGISSTGHIWTRAHNFSKQVESFICSWSAFAAQGIGIPHWGHCICKAHRHRASWRADMSQLGRACILSCLHSNTGALGQEAEEQERGLSGHTLCDIRTLGIAMAVGPAGWAGRSYGTVVPPQCGNRAQKLPSKSTSKPFPLGPTRGYSWCQANITSSITLKKPA